MQLVQTVSLVQFRQGNEQAMHVPLSSKKVSSHEQVDVLFLGPSMQLVQAVELVQFTQGGVHAVHVRLSSK